MGNGGKEKGKKAEKEPKLNEGWERCPVAVTTGIALVSHLIKLDQCVRRQGFR